MRTIIIAFILVLFSLISFAQEPQVIVSTGHTDQVNSIDMSSDGKWIATGSGDKLIKIIDAASGKELRTFSGNDGRVEYVRIDPTNQYVGATLYSDEIKVWKIETGELVYQHTMDGGGYDFEFCFGGSSVAFINDDGYLTVSNIQTKEEKVNENIIGIFRFTLGATDDQVVVYDYKSNLYVVDLKYGQVLRQAQLFNEFKYITCRMDVDREGKYVALAFDGNDKAENGYVSIYDLNDFKLKGKLQGHKSRINDLVFDNDSPDLISTGHTGLTMVWDVDKMKLKNEIKAQTFASNAVETHPLFNNVFLVADMREIVYVNQNTGKIIKHQKALGNKVVNMAYDQKGKYLVASTGDINLKVWNLEQNKIERTIMAFFPVAFDPYGKVLFAMSNSMNIGAFDPATGDKIYELPTEGELIQNLSLSKDGKYLSGAGFLGIINIWDLEKKKLVKHLTGHVGGIYGTAFSPDGKYLASGGMDQTVRVWDLSTDKEIKQITTEYAVIVSDVEFSPDGKHLAAASWDKKVKIYNTADWSLEKSLEGHTSIVTTINYSPDGKYLASGAGNNTVSKADNSVIIWDTQTGAQKCKFTKHTGIINKVIYDQTAPMIFSCGDDGTVKAWKPDNCEEVATFISVGKDDYVVVTPDNYYMASKNALDAVSFRIGINLYPFEQFDLKLNRPDIIGDRLGKSPQGLINAYKYLYKKRLRKMNFTEDMLGEDFHLPEIKVITQDIPLNTTKEVLKFTVKAVDSKYTLNRINVYVNDVPIYGFDGISVKDNKTQSIEKDIEATLMSGNNKVQVSVLNDKGVESLRSTFNIVYENEQTQGDLYVVTIGVSNYKDSSFNLKYAQKDARDIAATLEQSKLLYQKVHVKELTNSDVTKQNIIDLSTYLASAKPQDAVILFVAGHGVLDDQLDYFFATYDIDFNNPSENGVSYSVFEEILANVRSYRKLLIMDTCHSGELDKEEVEMEQSADVKEGDVTFRAAGAGVRQKEGFGMQNSVELMQEMFSDVRKGTGATVISSAGGAEYAMESDEWKNGLFTYCLLNGLKQKKADANFDGEINVSELREYVYNAVKTLSDGKQKPTARSENLSLDYRVW